MELAAGREAPRTSAAEEEALKRNTDCVYFLASPLTCKKGNKCEFRHSEGARFNPRDCWYWLNSNCLNPKCQFRHPPLDGVIGTQGNTAPALPSLQTAVSTHNPAVSTHNPAVQPSANNTSKQISPCYYFQKGQCLKGERCPFMHGPQATSNDLSPPFCASHDEPMIPNKDTRNIKQYSTQGAHLQQNVQKVVLDRPKAKPANSTKVHVSRIATGDSNVHTSNPRHLQNKSPVHVGHSLRTQIHERLHNGIRKETGKLLRDSSSGGVRGSDYFGNEGNLRRLATQDERNLNPEDDLQSKPNDHETMAKFEKIGYDVKSEHDQNGQLEHVYERVQATSSREVPARSLQLERRMVQKVHSSIEMDGSDLRHRLLKQKRFGSSRSGRGLDHYPRDNHVSEEKKHGHRDQKQASYESTISNRLQGRISFPKRSRSPENPANIRFEGGRDKILIGRVSPVRSLNHQVGHNRTIKQRLDKYLPKVASARGQTNKEEGVGSLNFAGPKSLAEIKRVRAEESINDITTKNVHAVGSSVLKRSGNVNENLDFDNSISFEGPKPLSTILKRKRELEINDGGEDSQQDKRVLVETSISRTVSNLQTSPILEVKKEVKDDVSSSGGRFRVGENQQQEQEEEQEDDEEGIVPAEDGELMYEDDDHPADQGDVVEDDYGMEFDTMDDQDPESYEQGEGELDYDGLEQAEDANTYQGDEDEFDDEDDDFARKLGVMHS